VDVSEGGAGWQQRRLLLLLLLVVPLQAAQWSMVIDISNGSVSEHICSEHVPCSMHYQEVQCKEVM
jgi:hypothetical protein